MHICRLSHNEIVYLGEYCPICDMVIKLKTEISELETEKQEAFDKIEHLEDKLKVLGDAYQGLADGVVKKK